jgi:hypothetical protein
MQNLNQLEALELAEFRVFQVSLTEIERTAHGPDILRDADALALLRSWLSGSRSEALTKSSGDWPAIFGGTTGAASVRTSRLRAH